MAKTNTLKRVKAASNPYMGMSVADMKKKYDTQIRGKKLSAKDLSVIANQMQAAKKASLKSKPASTKPASTKPKASTPKASTPKASTPPAARMPPNPPSPTVTKKGSKTGAAVDPRERSLRKNRQEAKRGSTSSGRANIRRMVNNQSGSSKRNQRQVEERRRRARAQGAKRNRRLMLSRRYNDS